MKTSVRSTSSSRRAIGVALVCCLIYLGIPATQAADSGLLPVETTLGGGSSESLVVPLYKSRVLRLSAPAARISVGNPDLADIIIVRARQLYVLGKDLGTTNVHLWDSNDVLIGTVSVEVSHDLESLKYKLHELLPGEDIEVFSIQRSMVLRGQVSSLAKMDTAIRLAEAYLAEVQTGVEVQEFQQQGDSAQGSGEVINMMQVGGGQQVMLEVKVAEISRAEIKRINAQFNVEKTASNWLVGGLNGGGLVPQTGGLLAEPLSLPNQGLFGTFLSNSTLFNIALDAARVNGLAKVLAEPTLTTLTGQEATFLSGGEFPVPVPQSGGGGGNTITIQFREFGISLRFLPVVLSEDTINLKVAISVSDIVETNSVVVGLDQTSQTFFVPSIASRGAESTVELKEGQTMGIAGLISENVSANITKFPGLGQLPILGALFRSQDFISEETELVITVTPHIAKPLAAKDIRLPTDSFVQPNDLDFYLMGRLQGRRKPAASYDANSGVEADFGHQAN